MFGDSEFLLGIFTGVIATVLCAILGSIIKYIIIPLYQRIIYRGVFLGGVWVGEKTSPRGKFGFKFELKQIGYKVIGTFFSFDEYSNKKRSRSYILTGEIEHNHLILKYKNSTTNQIGLGGFLFEILDGGDALLGSMMFLQTATGKVWACNELLLERRPI